MDGMGDGKLCDMAFNHQIPLAFVTRSDKAFARITVSVVKSRNVTEWR